MSAGFIISLFVIGIILLFLEVFVPGGILGFLGITSLILGIMLTVDTFAQGIFFVGLLLLTLAGLFILSFRLRQTRFIWDRVTLKTCQTDKEGYVTPKQGYETFLHQQGIALCQLRPAGTADFSGERLDVVTDGGFVTSGSKVKVIAVEGTRIIVRQVN